MEGMYCTGMSFGPLAHSIVMLKMPDPLILTGGNVPVSRHSVVVQQNIQAVTTGVTANLARSNWIGVVF